MLTVKSIYSRSNANFCHFVLLEFDRTVERSSRDPSRTTFGFARTLTGGVALPITGAAPASGGEPSALADPAGGGSATATAGGSAISGAAVAGVDCGFTRSIGFATGAAIGRLPQNTCPRANTCPSPLCPSISIARSRGGCSISATTTSVKADVSIDQVPSASRCPSDSVADAGTPRRRNRRTRGADATAAPNPIRTGADAAPSCIDALAALNAETDPAVDWFIAGDATMPRYPEVCRSSNETASDARSWRQPKTVGETLTGGPSPAIHSLKWPLPTGNSNTTNPQTVTTLYHAGRYGGEAGDDWATRKAACSTGSLSAVANERSH